MKVFYLEQLIVYFTISLVLHACIFGLINYGMFGPEIKFMLYYYIDKKSLYIFLFLIFFISISCNSYVFCDETVIVETRIDDLHFKISGSSLQLICTHLGSAGLFIGGVKVASAILSKDNMGALPKTGKIGGVGLGFTASFNIINSISTEQPVIVNLDNLSWVSESKSKNATDLLGKALPMFTIDSHKNIQVSAKPSPTGTSTFVRADNLDTSKILEGLDQINPDWRNSFIKSPLEPSISSQILPILNNFLVLNTVTMYLLFMLLFLYTSKLFLDRDIHLDFLANYPLGNYLKKLFLKYISIWKKTGSVWIYFILFSLLIFNGVLLYSTIFMINLLN